METVPAILRALAGIINNERTNNGYHFPRGSMARLLAVLTGGADGRARDGRTKYNDGTVVNFLNTLADCIERN